MCWSTANWRCYVYEDSLLVLHDAPYAADSADPSVQLSPCDGDSAQAIHAYPELADVKSQINDIAAMTTACLQHKSRLLTTFGDYHLFGYDFVCDAHYRAQLIEINGYPDLERRDEAGADIVKALMADLKTLIIDPAVSDAQPVAGKFLRVK